MEFRPRRTVGTSFGLVLTLAPATLAGLLTLRLLGSDLSLLFFSMVGLAAVLAIITLLFAYWTYGCWSLRYSLSRNNLAVRWGLGEMLIPLDHILAVHKGEARRAGRVRGLNWPCYHVGRAQVDELGEVIFFATDRSLGDLLYLVTPGGTYALSAPRREAFLEELRMLQRLGPSTSDGSTAYRRSIFRLPVQADRFTWALAVVGLLLNVSLFAYVFNAYPSLPQILPLSFTPMGEADRVGLRQEVFRLPLFGLAILGGNWMLGLALERWERLAAYLCFATAMLAQPLFWIAIVRIIG